MKTVRLVINGPPLSLSLSHTHTQIHTFGDFVGRNFGALCLSFCPSGDSRRRGLKETLRNKKGMREKSG